MVLAQASCLCAPRGSRRTAPPSRWEEKPVLRQACGQRQELGTTAVEALRLLPGGPLRGLTVLNPRTVSHSGSAVGALSAD